MSGVVYEKQQLQQLTESTKVGNYAWYNVCKFEIRLVHYSYDGSTVFHLSHFLSQNLPLQDVPLLLLALYEKATLSRAKTRRLLPEV